MTSEHNSHLSGEAQTRGRALRRYLIALERGDAHTLGDMLRQAEGDPALLALILATNDAEAERASLPAASADEIAQAQAALQARFPTLTGPVGALASISDRLRTIEVDDMNETDGPELTRDFPPPPTEQPGSAAETGAAWRSNPMLQRRRTSRWLLTGQALVAAVVIAALAGSFFAVFRTLNHGIRGADDSHSVIVGSGDGVISSLDPNTGALRWRYNTESGAPMFSGHPIYALVAQNGIVYAVDSPSFGVASYLWASRVSDGKVLWSEDVVLVGGSQASFALEQGVLLLNAVLPSQSIANAGAASTLAVRASDGAVLWQKPNSQFQRATSGVAYTEYVTATNPHVLLVALRVSDGKRLWQSDVGNTGLSIVAITPHVVYASLRLDTASSQIIALNSSTGEHLWTRAVPSQYNIGYVAVLAANQSTIYLRSKDGLCAQDLLNWRRLWCASLTLPQTGIVVGNIVYVTSFGANNNLAVSALASGTGKRLWQWNLVVPPAAATPVVLNPAGDQILVRFQLAATQGNVYVNTDLGAFAINGANGRQLWHALASEESTSVIAV